MTNQTVTELLGQGVVITLLGMGLVFAGLALLWGLMVLLARIGAPAQPQNAAPKESETMSEAEQSAADALTAERARVAVIVAGALLANAVPLLLEAPVGSVFEHGRTAPAWVTTNRARQMRTWQPPRVSRD